MTAVNWPQSEGFSLLDRIVPLLVYGILYVVYAVLLGGMFCFGSLLFCSASAPVWTLKIVGTIGAVVGAAFGITFLHAMKRFCDGLN